MLIGIDASRATVAQRTGTENYSLNLIRALLALGTEHRFRLYTNVAGRLPGIAGGPGVSVLPMPFPRLWTHLRLSAEMLLHPPDVLFVPAHVLPLIHPRRCVVTVHDLGYLHFPEAHRPLDRRYLDWSTRWNARQATALLADSQATRADLIRACGVSPGKVHVVYLGRDESLAPVRDPLRLAEVGARYGISGRYLLYVGTLQPRKNLARVIEAFARVLAQAPIPDLRLVLAGKQGWLYEDLYARVRSLGLTDRVLFPGYIPEDDLPALLSGALAFVFPSLYEGFGIPVLEAGACGVPVITSNTSSLPEVAGDAALLVDPHDVEAIAAAMLRLITDDALRAELGRRGLENVKRFSWEKCARETLEVLEEVGKPEAGSPKPEAGSWKLAAGSPDRQSPVSSNQQLASSNHHPVSLRILGIRVDSLTYADLLDRVAGFIAEGTPHQIATLNPEFVMEARRNPEFRAVLEGADLCLADGVGILWAARRQGRPLPERVTGSDGVPLIAERAAREGWRLYLLGAAPGVAERTAAILQARHPALQIAGTYAGSPSDAEAPGIIARIREARPHVLFVAYGAPAQDVWIARHCDALGVPVMMGVGGAFDHIAGVRKRAPRWVQRLNLEWLFRLITQPWRWRRQLDLPRFAWAVLTEKRDQGLGSGDFSP